MNKTKGKKEKKIAIDLSFINAWKLNDTRSSCMHAWPVIVSGEQLNHKQKGKNYMDQALINTRSSWDWGKYCPQSGLRTI